MFLKGIEFENLNVNDLHFSTWFIVYKKAYIIIMTYLVVKVFFEAYEYLLAHDKSELFM